MIMHMILATVAALPGCQIIRLDHIFGRDLAAAVPAMQSLPPELDLGLAPVPGHSRVFEAADLRRIAAQNHLDVQVSQSACFAWPMRVPSRGELLQAMQQQLKNRHAQIEIVDQSLWPAPEGDLSFPLTGLTIGSMGPSFWRGYVRYGAGARFNIWARVQISVKETHLVTTQKIVAGQALSAAQVSAALYEGPLTRDEPFTAVEQVIGSVAKFDIPAGITLTRLLVEKEKAVERGAILVITAENGNARVQAECIAEESGRVGDVIKVRNALSGRRFNARIASKGEAIISSTDGLGLTGENTPQ
jgi:flagella basal body P-ring formation protein FlgA